MHGSINEREFCDVVLIDHAQNWFLLQSVVLWVDNFLLGSGLQFSESIVWNQTKCLLPWFSCDGSEWCWNTTGRETVQVGLFLTFLIKGQLDSKTTTYDFEIGLKLVCLWDGEALLIPVACSKRINFIGLI